MAHPHRFLLVLLLLGTHYGFGQSNPVRLSFSSTRQLVIHNTDELYTYHVILKRRGQAVHDAIVAPATAPSFDYPFKRKHRVNQFSLVTRYDEQARDADMNRYRNLMNNRIQQANTIEATCFNEERQRQGWLLVAEGVFLEEGKLLEALMNILSSQSLDEAGLSRQLESLLDELQPSFLSDRRRSWLQGLVAYYESLLKAKVAPYSACPDLLDRKLNLLNQARAFRNAITSSERKFTAVQGGFGPESVWNLATNRQVFTPVSTFTGIGVETSLSAIRSALIASEGGKSTVSLVATGPSYQYTINLLLPVSRPFKGLVWHFPARLGVVASASQSRVAFRPGSDVYLGLQGTDVNTSAIVDQRGSIQAQMTHATLGLRYTFMPSHRMWLSWEWGGLVYNQVLLKAQTDYPYQVTNNRITSVTTSAQPTTALSLRNQVVYYGKVQYSIALFPLADKRKYPDRKKLVIGFSFGLANMAELPTATLNQINVDKNNQVSKSIPLKISSLGSIGLGLSAYL